MKRKRLYRDEARCLGAFEARVLANQEPLGAEFEAVLHKNLWDLYESENRPELTVIQGAAESA